MAPQDPPPTKTLSLRLPMPQWRRARVIAQYRGVSINTVIVDALREYIDRQLGFEAENEQHKGAR